ncbi:MAG TPA: L,D-transpeptidase family protein, partial [Methyloceanibacter sp.]|nr:L,D-transpeptidase family protein [Methyloceanibacter sp.]
MTTPKTKLHRNRSFVAIVTLFASLAAQLTLVPQTASALDPLNPFNTFTDSGPVTPEEREQREQLRADLYDRLSPAYRIDMPFVSDASIAALQQAIERYRQLVAAGGWPVTADKVTLRPGDTSSEIAAIRRHLIIEGDITGGSENNPTFNHEFLEGLARFQIRNGLRVSGFVDSRTLAALNVTAPERLKQLESNLARIQGMTGINKAPRYVLVNVPAFVAQAVQNGSLELESNVVAGKPARATPQVSAKIVEVNFYPTWTVPEIVAQQDLIPKIRKDPSYFSEEHFSVMTDWKSPPLDPATVDWNSPQVVSYKFRQDPGPFNALGLVRINMPNKYNVYMHDTPLKQLFSQSARAFSSGCVRVEKVVD